MAVDTVYFSDGVAVDAKIAIISSGFLAAPDAPTSRIYAVFDDFWAAHDVPDDFILSVTYAPHMHRMFALGRNGLIKWVGSPGQPFTFDNIRGQFQETRLRTVDTRGDMERIRAFASEVMACGWGGQLYWLHQNQWEDLSPIIANTNANFIDVNGNSSDDIYVAGMNGVAYHYDGSGWSLIDLPTNCHIFSILCLNDKLNVMCGSQGAFLIGARDRWQLVDNPKYRENLGSMASFGGDVYIAYANHGLLRFDWADFHEEAIGEGPPTTYRLSSKESSLWSIGSQDIGVFDGTSWQRLSCPDNA